VRRPDLIVVRREARLRVRREGGVIRASEVVVAVEIVSPGSRRMDHMMKRAEYAEAGIPHYWIVDLDDPVSLLACHLAGEFGFVDGGAVTGVFRTTEPFPVEIDLDALL
jgi:Uma2 family endonuclease